MSYLLKTDLESAIRDNALAMILDHGEDDNELDVFGLAKEEATAIVEDYLAKYDLVKEFAKTGSDRHKSLVFHLKNICLYILWERVDDDLVPERVTKNYNDTIDILQKVSMGKLSMALDIKQIDTDGDGEADSPRTKFRYGGEKPRSY